LWVLLLLTQPKQNFIITTDEQGELPSPVPLLDALLVLQDSHGYRAGHFSFIEKTYE